MATALQRAVRFPVRHGRDLSDEDAHLVVETIDFHLALACGKAPKIDSDRWRVILETVRTTGHVTCIMSHEFRIIDNDESLTAELGAAIDASIPF